MIEKKLAIHNQQIHVQIRGADHLPAIVFLHGFTGASSTWNDVMEQLAGCFKMVAIDLTGHGQTSVPEDISRYTMEAQIKDLEAVFDALNLTDFALVGYSMGGRVALGYTVHYPSRVATLILESASPGLKTIAEQKMRRQADEKLAQKITTEGIHNFVDFWENIPLFESQKRMSATQQQKVREERLAQDEIGLANSLKGMGTGSQPSYWGHLKDLNLPVLLLTGEMDQKFVDISREMVKKLPNVTSQTIKNVGHAIHVEKPALFATMVKEHVIVVNN